jgi:membrane-associated phospholipid phosphatase
MRFKALVTSAALSILFLVVYGGCNWITSQRSDVGVFYFAWERAIPFVPFLILPYLSIDLFFIAAPFLCGTERELRVFSRRVTAAILVAGICFLLFPLRFAFERPPANGWPGALFDWFRGLDAPYNLLPSLHAAFWMFLVPLYLRHTRGFVRSVVMFWLALVGLSPVLTYQHHVIDIITGFALAGYCFYVFRESSEKPPVMANYRTGFYYFAGALLMLTVAVISWPWGVLLLWPGVALGIVGVAYFGVGPIIFRKTAGQLPWSTRFVLGPCLLGQYFSLLYYRRQCRPWDKITPRVWIGCKLRDREADAAICAGVTAVLDLSAEFSEARPLRTIIYKNIPVLDLTAPTLGQLMEMASFISEESQKGIVYVHCKIGYSRSAAAVAAYLIMSGRAGSVDKAVAIIRGARPSIVIRPEIMSALQDLTGRGAFQVAHGGLETAAP